MTESLRRENHFRVEGFDEFGTLYTDDMILHHAAEEDKRYVYVADENNKHVVNWFEKYDLSNIQEISLQEGYYSTFDTIEDLFRHKDAKAVFEKFFGQAAEDPRFSAMKGVMSIEKMSEISAFNIPKKLLSLINMELNNIKKTNCLENPRIPHNAPLPSSGERLSSELPAASRDSARRSRN